MIMIVVAIVRPSLSVRFALDHVFSKLFIVILFKCVSDVIVNNNVIIHILSIVSRICTVKSMKKGKNIWEKDGIGGGPGVNKMGFL
jgi:hypothetical protein